ncbi:related to 20beta-hydroxysteroid dehydrogenase [Cephalotrichum gorgonifer]|uniref:Related to 20beta-hydroxysteroid dehydrogenase n=1 Tax=Cephalotrichum gorgonifer TaxID=2041049 RepID=A0AAE8SZ22_9PEZI|nr:related to 20beta-hydroxysteroid dehydrogenase [Cephalotrichum gorgonifer]
MAQTFKKGGVALITGGASGIGLAIAKKCLGHGMRVIIVDKNPATLADASKISTDITVLEADVGRKEDWDSLKSVVERDFGGRIDFLALNAGMGMKSPWDDPSAFSTTFNTNIMGVVNGVSTFLPLVKRNASAGTPSSIVITGSKQGITNPPGNPAYNASKAAVKSLAEHLSWDLRNEQNLSVHLLVPGWTFTGMTGPSTGTGEKPAGAWLPEQVADFLEKKMGEGQFWVLCPDNEVTEALDRKRVAWGAGDLLQGRPPLSRWRENWKERAQEGINNMEV